MKTSGVIAALVCGLGLTGGATAQAADPISENAAVYMTYQSDSTKVADKPFKSAGDIDSALDTMGAYNADQLTRGWMAYSALIASQDREFASTVRDIESYYGREAVMKSFAAGNSYARSLKGGDDAVGQSAEGQRFDPDLARTPQGGEEEAFPAEQGRLDLAHGLDVEGHGVLVGHHATGNHAEDLAGSQNLFQERSAGMDEGPSVALEALHDEPLAAEEPDSELALEGDAHAHALGGEQEGILLADEFASELGQIHCYDLARIRGSETRPGLPRRLVLEDGHEQRLAGEQALAGSQQGSHEPALLLGPVTEDGLHLDALFHEHHAAGFGHHGFHGVEEHFDILQVVSADLVFDFVHHGGRGGGLVFDCSPTELPVDPRVK